MLSPSSSFIFTKDELLEDLDPVGESVEHFGERVHELHGALEVALPLAQVRLGFDVAKNLVGAE
jgi:hypothetical protein